MNIDINIIRACEGFWGCLTSAEWLQLISVIIAMLAAIASFVAVYLTRKQFKEESGDRRKKYRPFFKIHGFHKYESNKFFFDIVNEGFPFYVVNSVKWQGGGKIELKHFNARMERKKNNEIVEKYENYAIVFKIQDESDFEGYIELSGYDIEHNYFIIKTPLIIINNGEITNDLDVTYQYLR